MNLHTKVQRYILDQIESGTLKPDDQIPTEMELMQLLGVSRPTVRQALTKLTEQGYLLRVKGKGSFVKEPKLLHRSMEMIASYRQESESRGLHIQTEVLLLEEQRASETVAGRLHLKAGGKVGVLTRLRRLDGRHDNHPVVLTTVYVPLQKFPDFLLNDFSCLSFYEYLEQKGLAVTHASRMLDVTHISEAETKLLEISPFEPVIRVVSVGLSANGLPVEYTESLYPAGSSSFQIEIDR